MAIGLALMGSALMGLAMAAIGLALMGSALMGSVRVTIGSALMGSALIGSALMGSVRAAIGSALTGLGALVVPLAPPPAKGSSPNACPPRAPLATAAARRCGLCACCAEKPSTGPR